MKDLILSLDIGTTSLKTCLYRYSGGSLELLAAASRSYSLQIGTSGEAEQDPEDWWKAISETLPEVMQESGADASGIGGIGFCSQMQGLVLCGEQGEALRPAMSYMDQRAGEQKDRFMNRGPCIEGIRVDALILGLRNNGAAPASVKDPLWKYLWVKEKEPEIFARVRWWLDVKEYLIYKMTGRAVMTEDTAFATFLYDTRKGKKGWDRGLIRKYGVDGRHMPPVIASTDSAGTLLEPVAREWGLSPETQVFASGGDATLIGLGAGSVQPGDTHIYTGTSGWVSAVVEKRELDLTAMIASVPSARKGYYDYFAEQETAGKCLEWVRDHLALDEIQLYLDNRTVLEEPLSIHNNLYDFLVEEISKVPAGSRGVLFTPWLHGNRSPFEDPNARGIFFNLGLDTGKRAMIRAVIEGIMFHQRWQLESLEKRVKTRPVLRYVGGGARNPYLGQMLADILGRVVEIPENPHFCGAAGAALIASVGLKLAGSFEEAVEGLKIGRTFEPRKELSVAYDKNYTVFLRLYRNNRRNFQLLNAETP